MAKTVRLSDIAQRCGVSTVTVSKALSGQKGVSSAMRARIIELADQMGYIRNPSRGEQQERSSYIIGVIVAERYLADNQSFYWKMYQDISKVTVALDSFCILEVVSIDSEKEAELPKVITEKKVDGLIVQGQFTREYMLRLSSGRHKVPMVFLDVDSMDLNQDCVVSNNEQGAKTMTDYLFGQGHCQIGFVGTRLCTSSIDERYMGYLRSLMVHGQTVREEWILDDRDRHSGRLDKDLFFRLPAQMPTAFFCNCDLAAAILIRKLEEHGYSVPGDISVVGFDNYLSEPVVGIGLTTYEINTWEMARRSVDILFLKLSKNSTTPCMLLLPGKFIERNSVKAVGFPVMPV